MRKRTRLCVAVVLIVAVAAMSACASSTPPPATGASTAASPRSAVLPAIVDGLPTAKLAALALQEASAWSESTPTRVRAVLSSQAGLERALGHSYGSTASVYIVALDGHFTCKNPCAVSVPAGLVSATPTTSPAPVTVSHMAFTVDLAPVRPAGSLTVGRIDPDLSALGHVVDLQPYVTAAH